MSLDMTLYLVMLSLVLLSMGILYMSPLKVLVNLEYFYLGVGMSLMLWLFSQTAWCYLFLIMFSASESVFVLSCNMVSGKFVGQFTNSKHLSW